ncbi:unnamed protein product [Rhizoctonia solani]|uniref:F-box domain-containing protein n=1 Tax=Rhizoctonia solani TaxID=456999 RepID=A0A8H3HSK1_9AGAM|nr:unnamed protein product [Rhizoctonia solani]
MVAHVLNQLSEQDIRVASRVCKAWYFLALPRVYKIVLLKKDSCLKEFSRIITGDEDLTSPISAYIHTLRFQPGLTKRTAGLPFINMVPYVSRLSHLRNLFWELSFLPENLELVKALQTQCPLLDNVILRIPDSIDIRSENGKSRYANLLEFKNLTYFTLDFFSFPTSARDLELLEPLKTIAVNSPMLERLVVEFRYIPMTLEHVIFSLGADFILPCLGNFRLHACLNSDPDDTGLPRPSGSGVDQFLAFLSRHPCLNQMTLNCPFYVEFYEDFGAGVLAQELPRLIHLSGPYFLCEQALQYPIGERVRCLSISSWESSLSYENLTDELCLPYLRRLHIEVDDIPRAMEMLESISPAAEGLEGLYFPVVHHRYHEDFLEILSHIPRLGDVFLWYDDSHFDNEDTSSPNGSSRTELMAAMQDKFPELEIKCMGKWE